MNKNEALLEACDHSLVLVVDDDEEIRDIFQLILTESVPECKIETAVNGADALENFTRKHQGLLIMDLHMPVMDGQEAFSRIEETCAAKKWQMPTVIFCTAYNPPRGIQSIIENSRKHDLVRKPLTNETLVEIVRTKLGL